MSCNTQYRFTWITSSYPILLHKFNCSLNISRQYNPNQNVQLKNYVPNEIKCQFPNLIENGSAKRFDMIRRIVFCIREFFVNSLENWIGWSYRATLKISNDANGMKWNKIEKKTYCLQSGGNRKKIWITVTLVAELLFANDWKKIGQAETVKPLHLMKTYMNIWFFFSLSLRFLLSYFCNRSVLFSDTKIMHNFHTSSHSA